MRVAFSTKPSRSWKWSSIALFISAPTGPGNLWLFRGRFLSNLAIIFKTWLKLWCEFMACYEKCLCLSWCWLFCVQPISSSALHMPSLYWYVFPVISWLVLWWRYATHASSCTVDGHPKSPQASPPRPTSPTCVSKLESQKTVSQTGTDQTWNCSQTQTWNWSDLKTNWDWSNPLNLFK